MNAGPPGADLRSLCNRAVEFHRKGQWAEAERIYLEVLAADPGNFNANHLLGVLRRQQGRSAEAIERIAAALEIRPGDAEAMVNYGLALKSLGRLDEALASYERVLAAKPDFAGAHNNRGNVLQQMGRSIEALAAYDRALAIDPDYAEVHANRANALSALRRFDEALESYERALARRPDHVEALIGCGDALWSLQRVEEALASYDRAIARHPDHAEAHGKRGVALALLGRQEDARTAYARSLALDPRRTGVYLGYADTLTFEAGDAQLKAMEALREEGSTLGDTERLQLDFALAKAYDDLGDAARSFTHLLRGNALKRAQIRYDEAAEHARFERIEAVFTEKLLREKERLGGGDPSPVPVFIIGMMRSGSTLIEQILASHPAVHGAGERAALRELAREARGAGARMLPYPEFVPGLDAASLTLLGARYADEIRALAPSAARITDKMPANYFFAGLIHLILPHARIIHSVRDPLDTCLSCFSKLFTEPQDHAYDLAELGRYYRRYAGLMAHWRRVLPAGRILEVRYEALVADLEGEARRIIAHCGLEWDARCLSFHATDRPVRTASALQVRRPVYQSAAGRARPYEEFLGPLKEALGEALGDRGQAGQDAG